MKTLQGRNGIVVLARRDQRQEASQFYEAQRRSAETVRLYRAEQVEKINQRKLSYGRFYYKLICEFLAWTALFTFLIVLWVV